MQKRHIAVATLLTAIVHTASGQGAPTKIVAATPAECTKSIAEWRVRDLAPATEIYTKASPETKTAAAQDYTKALSAVATKVEALSRQCAESFDIAKIPADQLIDLVRLYNAGKDTVSARRGVERMLAAKDQPPAARAQALTFGMNQEITKASSYFGIIAGAEKFVAEIDALPESVDDLKLAAHTTMLGRYEYLDVADGLRNHATAVIALARKLNRPATIITGYSSLARSYADRLQPDSALRLLDVAEKELGAAATRSFADFRNRYALIGQKAEAIPGQWWINSDRKSEDFVLGNGKVTLIEFTAHWCGPCKNSYPGLIKVADTFKGKAFQGVMITSLYGYLGTKQGLTPEQEVEADREYFGKEHALPFPVAINATPKATPVAAPAANAAPRAPGAPLGTMTVPPIVTRVAPKPDLDYRVGGIPQLVIVDKKGIIRQIVIGWDQGNTARFSKVIQELLNEK